MRWLLVLCVVLLALPGCSGSAPAPTFAPANGAEIGLPPPSLEGGFSLEQALLNRRSVRSYSDEALTLAEVSQLLWACQGVAVGWGGRTAPSAGALYPLEVYLVAGEVDGLEPGVYKYVPDAHDLVTVGLGDVRDGLAGAALGQSPVRDAPADIVISGVYERTTGKYGDRGIRYVHMEAGHAAQNVCLQAVALDLGAVTIGAFVDNRVEDIVGMTDDEAAIYIIPVGRPQ